MPGSKRTTNSSATRSHATAAQRETVKKRIIAEGLSFPICHGCLLQWHECRAGCGRPVCNSHCRPCPFAGMANHFDTLWRRTDMLALVGNCSGRAPAAETRPGDTPKKCKLTSWTFAGALLTEVTNRSTTDPNATPAGIEPTTIRLRSACSTHFLLSTGRLVQWYGSSFGCGRSWVQFPGQPWLLADCGAGVQAGMMEGALFVSWLFGLVV